MKRISSYRLLGLQVDALTVSDLQTIAVEAVEKAQQRLIANHNLHSVYLYHHDPKMRKFYDRAKYVLIDGMPLILLGKLRGYPLRSEHRSGAVDYIPHLMSEAVQRGWRVFHLGSEPGVAERGAEVLRKDFPGLQMETVHGYFNADPDSDENQEILQRINNYQPNVLIVGMGMPRQEHWIVDNWENIQANVVLSTGAYMDFVSGTAPTPPRWMGPLSLEWLYRFVREPRRLWKRYLLEPWFVLWVALKEWITRGGVRA